MTALATAPLAPARPTRALPAPAPVRTPARIAEPAGLADWRAAAGAADQAAPPAPGQVARVLAGVRAGAPLAAVARTARLSQSRALDIVVGVGSRMSQANKTGPKAALVLSGAEGAAAGAPRPGAAELGGRLAVVLAPGWERTAGHGRDIGRAYAAIVLADPAADARPVSRWLGTLAAPQPVTYAHYAHLRSVATGKMRTFIGLTEDRDVQAAYLRAFDDLADAVADAGRAVGALCAATSPAQALAALRGCYWLLPDSRSLVALARAAAAGDPVASSRLRVVLANLRVAVTRAPARFFPRDLADLSTRQFRAILAERGHHPADMADAARAETDFSELSATLAAIRERVLAGADLDGAAEQVTALAQTWHGRD